MREGTATVPYDVAASIVTFETDAAQLQGLVARLLAARLRVAVTVVDNSPDDRLRAAAETAGAAYHHMENNAGYGAGHNVALARMLDRARYLLVVYPDIAFAPGTLEALVEFLDRHPEAGQLMPAVVHPDGSEQRLTKQLPTPADLFLRRFLGPAARRLRPRYEMRHLDMRVPRQVPSLSGCFMLMRASVLAGVGLFDERYFLYMEDVDLCRRIGEVSDTVFFPGATVVHGYQKGSYRNLALFRRHMLSALQYFQKWGWFRDPRRRAQNRRTAEVGDPGGAAAAAAAAAAADADAERGP
jgi:GT2 family glycosyltransferase